MPHNLLAYLHLAKEAVVAVVAGIGAIVARYRLLGARHWPAIHGRIEFCEAHNDDGGRWKISIYYSYQVNSEYYSGLQDVPVGNESRAEELASMLKDQFVTVRHSPRDAADSVLLPEDQAPFLELIFRRPMDTTAYLARSAAK